MIEKINTTLPGVVAEAVSSILAMREMSTEFYKNNADLVNHKKEISEEYKRLAKENSNKTVEELLKLSEAEVRRKYNIKKAAPAKKAAPQLPRKSQDGKPTGQPNPQRSKIENDIAAMDEALENF